MLLYSITLIAAILQFNTNIRTGTGNPLWSNLRLTINSERYSYCQVFIIREKFQNDLILRKISLVPERITNPQLNQIIQENQERVESETLFTWTVKDSECEFLELWKCFTPHQREEKSFDFNTTLSVSTFHVEIEHFCTIFISWHYGVYSGIKTPVGWKTDLVFKSQWSFWYIYASGYGKITLRLQNTLLLSVRGFEPSIFAYYDSHHEAMLLAPFLTFVIQIPFRLQIIENFTIQKVWWACYICTVERQLYFDMKIFDGNLNLLIQQSYGEIKVCRKDRRTGLRTSQILPMLNAILTNRDDAIWFRPRIICFMNRGIEPHIYYGKYSNQRGGCLDPSVLSITILAEKLNMTASFGGLIGLKHISLHNQVSITVFNLGQTWLELLNPVTTQIFLLDNIKFGFRYCEPFTKPISVSIFAIFGDPFDKFTWIFVIGSLISIIYYFYWNCSSLLDCMFDIVVLVFQRTSKKKYKFAVIFLFGFFFLEFFFLSTATEKMIAPRKPYVVGTLSELFRKRYYLFDNLDSPIDPFEYSISRWEAIKEKYHKDLEKEGMSSFLFAPLWKYLRLIKYQDVYEEEPDGALCFNPKNRKLIQRLYVSSAQGYQETTVAGPCKNLTCHTVPKRYGHEYELTEVYSKIRSRVKTILSRIVHESGLRAYWINLDKRLNKKQLYRYEKREDVAVIKLKDLRFLAILYVFGALLGIAGVMFITENILIILEAGKNLLSRILNYLKQKLKATRNIGLFTRYRSYIEYFKYFCRKFCNNQSNITRKLKIQNEVRVILVKTHNDVT